MNAEELVKFWDKDEDDGGPADPYDEDAQREAVKDLDLQTLCELVRIVKGCGCCVSGGALRLRGATFEELAKRFRS